MKRIFIDFDNIYKFVKPDKDTIIFTSDYSNDWSVNIYKNKYDRQILENFERIIPFLTDYLSENQVIKSRSYLYYNFFFPLGNWIESINKIINSNCLESNIEIVFSSYSNNINVFLFEAEGENNREYLYQRSYFLSYYLKLYLTSIGFNNLKFQKNNTVKSFIHFYLRGFTVALAKLSQLVFYKIFVLRRDFIKGSIAEDKNILLSTRGIVQTQFANGIFKILNEQLVVIVNESSSKPFRNLKEVKRNINNFFYAEGFLSLSQLFREFSTIINAYLTKKTSKNLNFYGIKVDLNSLIPELSILLFHCSTYSISIKNSLSYLKNKYDIQIRKGISFEMLLPFAYYLREQLNIPIIQIQTTLIKKVPHPNFVYGNKFYFNNEHDYLGFLAVSGEWKIKFSFLNNLKYIHTNRKKKIEDINEIKLVTYFSQPIFYDEEIILIKFLNKFYSSKGVRFQVKLHPRSKIKKISISNCEYLNKNISSTEVITKSDIVVTRNSSIGFDAWSLNVPIIFFVNASLNNTGVSFAPSDYIGTIQKVIDEYEFEEIHEKLLSDFYSHRMQDNYIIDTELIIKEILK